MKALTIISPLRDHLKHLALALTVAVGLGAGSAQALTATATYNLGTSPAKTTIQSGVGGLLPWIAKGTLPPGSFLKRVTIDAKIEDVGNDETTDDWASDLNVYLDPSPGAPGTAALLQVGGYGPIGTASLALTDTTSGGWANGQGGPPATVSDTKLEAAWAAIGVVDLSTVELSVGNDYSEASWSGTITVEYEVLEPAKITTFGPGAVVGTLSGNAASIAWTVPSGTDVTNLAPTFTLSSGTCDKTSGGTYNFTSPVVYTVTDGATVNTYTVTVTVASAVLWNVVGDGLWDISAPNWLTQPGASPTAFANGNEAIFSNTGGGTITIDPNISPFSTTVSSGTYTFTGSPIAGGALTNNGTLSLKTTPSNFSSTTINGSLTYVADSGDGGFGTDVEVTLNNVTINSGGVLLSKRMKATGNVTLNGGTYREASGWGENWNGSTYLAADSFVNANGNGSLHLNGPISGPGGLTTDAVGNPAYSGVYLSGTNSYSGETIVNSGGLWCENSSALGNGGALTIASGAVAILNYTGSHNVSALTLGGVAQTNPGTYGSTTSDATFKSSYFTGTGTVTTGNPASAALVTSFGTNVVGSSAVIEPPVAGAAAITWYVPFGTDLATLAPDFTLSPGATCSNQTSGVVPSPNFSAGPVVYTVVSQDTLNTITYTVTATILPNDTSVTWNLAGGGNWNLTSSNWIGQPSNISRPYFDGANVIFNNTAGGTITIDPNMSPLSTTVSAASGTYTFSGGPIATGSLIKDGDGTLVNNDWNSYSGGTIIEKGTLQLNWPGDANPKTSLGSGPVTLNGGLLRLDRTLLANELTVNGGAVYLDNGFGNTLTGAIILHVDLNVTALYANHPLSGDISGVGGITMTSVAGGGLDLSGTNTYTGDTIVNGGILKVHGSSIKDSNKLVINSGGKVEPIGTETVASLFFGATQQATGTWGASGSGAAHIDDNRFSGTAGVVNVSAASPYSIWADGTFSHGTLSDKNPASDPDGDGQTNQQEFAFGLDPTSGASVNPISQQLNKTTGVFKYTRTKDSGLTYTYQSSTTLVVPWDVFTPDSAISNNATPVEEITVTVPSSLLVGSKLFLRVKAQ